MEPGGVVYVRLRTAAPGPTTIAIRLATLPEHHGRLQTFSVELDGREICSEDYVDPGAGSSRTMYCELTTSSPTVTLRLRAGWRNGFPITLEAVRSYRFPDEGERSPAADARFRMGLALLTSRGHGFAIDRDEMRRIMELIPPAGWFEPQAAVLYNFCTKQPREQLTAMRAYADLAASLRFPLRVLPQFHWAGIPKGVPDGAGGTFTDVPYQQITWDEADQTDDPGLRPLLGERWDIRFGLSIPNRWSNTPWLTFNHPRLNQFRRIRLREAITAWLAARDRLARWGLGRLFPMELSTGEEAVYWAKGVDDSAYTEVNGGRPRTALLADFNPFVVADALADGIVLDPSNGLDRNERWWLHQNLSRWQQTIVNWMLENVPPEPIRATPQGPVYADDLIRRNIFTEPYAMPMFPMRGVNPRRPGLETGYVREGRSGGEYWSGAEMLPWLIKQRERGRTALPNLECTGADDAQLEACLLATYAHGGRYATLYNWHHRNTTREILARVARGMESGSTQLTEQSGPVEGLNEGERAFTGRPDAFGVNTILITVKAGDPLPALVRATLRTLDEKPARRMSITEPVGTAQPNGTVALRFPAMFHVRPGERYVVLVEACDQPGQPWRTLAAAGVANIADVRLERWRSLAVQDWQDTEDILEALRARDADPWTNPHARERLRLSETLLNLGRPVAAYRAAIRAEQLLYPSTFTVLPPGATLRPFQVEVVCSDDPVRVTIRELTPAMASLTLFSTSRQTVQVRYRGKRMDVQLSPETPVRTELEVAGGPRA